MGDWTLIYPGVTYTWGDYSDGVMLAAAPDLGGVEVVADDARRPREDGRAFGVDYFGARTVTFELLVLGVDETQVRERAAQLATVWRGDPVRTVPGAVAELHTVNAGRARVAYGRPRRFAPVEKYAKQGLTGVVADFAAVDSCWYDPAEQSVVVPLVPPPSGGMVAPLAAPLTTVPPVQSTGAVTVGGDLPAWPVITFHGPVTNPACAVTGLWTLELATTLAVGEAVTVDTRPWRRTVLRGDEASFAGALTRHSPRLAKATLPPGTYEIALRGVDVSGTAQMTFAWQNTHSAL